jgi:heme-degrading monooxygenase HmoA
MFARNVSMHLKPNTAGEFTRTLERDIVPLLRKQSGFADELTFLGSDGTEAVAISLWDRQESADAYNRNGYAEVLKGLSKVVEGTPVVRTYEVSNSTFHTIPAHN